MSEKIKIGELKRGQLVKMVRDIREASKNCDCGCPREDKIRVIYWEKKDQPLADGTMGSYLSIYNISEYDFKWSNEGHIREDVKAHSDNPDILLSLEATHYIYDGH